MSLPTEQQVATEIRATVDGLLNSRKNERFTDFDQGGAGGRVGAAASLQGLRAVYGALAALPEDRELWALVKPFHASLIKEWQAALAELASTNYGPDPYDDENRSFEKLRTEADGTAAPYVDTVAWAVSTSVLINYLFPALKTNWNIKVDEALVEATRSEIARSVRRLLDLQLEDGGWGWGRQRDLKSSHMYFTWTAIQGLADLFDYVYGDSDTEIKIPIDTVTQEDLEKRDPTLEKDVATARDEAAQYFRDTYLSIAMTSTGLSYPDLTTFVGNQARVSVGDQSTDIPLLYFYSYLLEALILSSYDKNNPAVVASRRSEMDRLYAEVKKRFAQVRPKATAEDLDPLKSTAQITISGEKVFGRTNRPLNSYVINDPGLWPQILRTLVLYPYYVERPKFPDEDIVGAGGAYGLLLRDRRSSDADAAPLLWDKYEFNLSITARALEGLIDVYDYVRLLAEKAREQEAVAPPPALAELLADALYPHVRLRLQSDHDMPTAAAPPETRSETFVRSVALGAAESELSETSAEATHVLLQRFVTMDSKAIKSFVDEVIGKDHDSLNRDNPAAYKFITAIVVASLATTSRLLAQILQEAIFAVATEAELADNAQSFKGDPPLYKRLRLALREVLRQEIGTDGWSLESVVRQLLLLSGTGGTPPPAAPTRGRRANP